MGHSVPIGLIHLNIFLKRKTVLLLHKILKTLNIEDISCALLADFTNAQINFKLLKGMRYFKKESNTPRRQNFTSFSIVPFIHNQEYLIAIDYTKLYPVLSIADTQSQYTSKCV